MKRVSLIVIATFFADLGSKLIVSAWRPGWVIKNSGLPFFGWDLPGFFDAVLVGLLFVIFLIFVAKNFWQFSTGVALIIGGAIGNLFDRLRQGYVIDFIPLTPWNTLNLADLAILIGILLVIFRLRPNKSIENEIVQIKR